MTTKEAPKRGRPKKSDSDVQSARNKILTATRTVFGRYGSKGLTVERIIQAAGVSRPTFYKYFDKAEAPLDIIVERTNDSLVRKVLEATVHEKQSIPRMQIAIDTYLAWGKEELEILGAIQQELLTAESVVAKHRFNTLNKLYELLKSTLEQEGRPAPDRIVFDSMLIAAENLGYHLLLNTDSPSAKPYRLQMLKLGIALFGNKEDWQVATRNNALFEDF